jgi:hypothetical protein
MKKTMLGMAPNMATPAPAPAPQLKGTMLGMPAMVAPPGQVAAAPIAAPAVPVGRSPGDPPAGKQTIIGVAAPPIPQPPAAGAAPGAGEPNRLDPEHKKTMLGVAMPGIAPLAPGVPKEPLAPNAIAPEPGAFAPAYGPPPQPGYQPASPFQAMPDAPRRVSARPPVQRRPQYSATIALVGGLVLAAGAVAFAFFWRSPAPLRAEARVDSTGTDLLHITCATCPDGTELRIGEARAKITAQVADVLLPSPLGVGENAFNVEVDRPGSGRDEKVSLMVKIGYRIRPDLSGLDSDHPLLRILVDGAPLAKMVIDGKPLDLGSDGKGSYDIDITADCTGLADETKTLERSVPYSVAGASGAAEQGVVGLRVAVTPLHIDAPSTHAVVDADRFLFGGRTGRGGRLLADGDAIPVAADGTFSKQLAPKAVGDNTVALRATMPGFAPRLAGIRVKRVERLADEARTFAASAPLSFADLSADVNKHVGEPVVLSGDIVEARPQGTRDVALLDVQKGCARPPCVARVVLTGSDAVARGDHVQVFGHVTRAIGTKGETTGTVPEVEGDFFLKRH